MFKDLMAIIQSEWNLGLQQRFGLQYINYTDPNLTRTYKMSFFQVRDFFRQHLGI